MWISFVPLRTLRVNDWTSRAMELKRKKFPSGCQKLLFFRCINNTYEHVRLMREFSIFTCSSFHSNSSKFQMNSLISLSQINTQHMFPSDHAPLNMNFLLQSEANRGVFFLSLTIWLHTWEIVCLLCPWFCLLRKMSLNAWKMHWKLKHF